MKLLLLGNPNVGKTSLFNHITGLSARVGNYPGVTVERRYAEVTWLADNGDKTRLTLTDLPGTYSLSARSPEEEIAISAVLGWSGFEKPDAVIVVVNANQLSRNLYLLSQILELRVPAVVALNMVDEVQGTKPDKVKLSAALGVPVVETNGNTGAGKDELMREAVTLANQRKPFIPRLNPSYPAAVIAAADRVSDALPAAFRGSVERDRTFALWALMSIDEDDELANIPQELRSRVLAARQDVGDVDLLVSVARYKAIEEALSEAFGDIEPKERRVSFSERLDGVMLHPLWGFAVFLTSMFIVFQALFSWADPFIGWIETLVSSSQTITLELMPDGLLREAFVDGVLGGVGNVIVFLPQILLLFLFIGLLEDSGYMARIAYLVDRVMRTMGLHGRAFVPMLSGFACAIPAIMATRTLERRRDQLLTMMVVPLMTCSARLPVYTLIIAALFPRRPGQGAYVQSGLMVALYAFSMLTALVAAFVLSRTVIPSKSVPLILELPPYRVPRLGPTLRMMRTRASQFLSEAGTVILAATIVLWTLLSFPRVPAEALEAGAPATSSVSWSDTAPPLADSYAGMAGKAIEPAMAPLGFDWKITTAIIGAFAAREVFVSTLGLIFGIEDADETALPLRERIRAERAADGSPKYTPLMGLSLMVFFALACQCMSTLAVVRRETRSYKWPLFLFAYMTTLAYVCSFVVYQGGRILGY